ncbi:MFS transporter [Halobacillus rhizosphaerae]|uniref:MFS transporter n=1 Tax=Halobacillus rhizosphaerae TaxID=3064889 RepID=UPI00398B6EDE
MEIIAKGSSLLRNKNFIFLWIGGGISGLASSIYLLIEQWYIVNYLDLNQFLGIIMMATTIPRVVLMAFGGVLADEQRKTNIAASSLFLRFILLVIMAIFFKIGLLKLFPLFIFALLFGAISAFFWPARDSLVPTLVKEENIVKANSFIQTTNQLALVMGPFLGTLLLHSFSYTSAFICNGLLLLLSGWMFANIKEKEGQAEKPKQKSVFKNLMIGVKYVQQQKFLVTIMVTFIFTNLFFIGPLMLSIPLYADEKFGGAAINLSVLQSGFSMGMVIGAVIMGYLNVVNHRGYMIIVFLFSEGFLMFLYSQIFNIYFSAILLFLIGVCISSINIPVMSLIQEKVHKDKLGRVMSLNTMVSIGLIPVSYALVSALLSIHIDISQILFDSSLIIVTLSVFILWKGRTMRTLN